MIFKERLEDVVITVDVPNAAERAPERLSPERATTINLIAKRRRLETPL